MGQLYDLKMAVDAMIARKGVEEYATKGRISAQAGFVLSLVKPETPDDGDKVARLRAAISNVLGEQI